MAKAMEKDFSNRMEKENTNGKTLEEEEIVGGNPDEVEVNGGILAEKEEDDRTMQEAKEEKTKQNTTNSVEHMVQEAILQKNAIESFAKYIVHEAILQKNAGNDLLLEKQISQYENKYEGARDQRGQNAIEAQQVMKIEAIEEALKRVINAITGGSSLSIKSKRQINHVGTSHQSNPPAYLNTVISFGLEDAVGVFFSTSRSFGSLGGNSTV